jgi:hypothetical protein
MATKKDRTASGSAIAGAGGVTAAAGLAGGGVPGVRSNRIMADVQQASGRRKKAGEATRAYRGGEFGYRTNAHQTFKTFGLGGKREGESRVSHFKHGMKAGKLVSEDKIIPHLKVARRASNAALVGGAGAVAYGVHRAKSQRVAKADDRKLKQYSGATLGAGATVAGLSAGGARVAEHQGRKWSQQAVDDLEGARKIVPKMGGHVVNPFPKKVKNKRVPDIGPAKGNSLIQNDERIMAGKSRAQAHAAGKLRGSAAQSRYFAGTYGSAAGIARKVRNPALAVAGVGAGGLALTRKKDGVKKSDDSRMSAFGVMH